MELIYKYAESTVKPVEVEMGKTTIYIRKDIIDEERTDDKGNKTTFWTYQEAKLTHEEFAEYSSFLRTTQILQIINKQEVADDNQLIIMDAIADLYEMITNKS